MEASTASEAIEKMLERKKISSKINYDVLRDLNLGGAAGESPSRPASDPSPITPQKRLNRRRKSSSTARLDLASTTSSMAKR